MIHPSPELLDASEPATVFLALRWNEFFDRYTIDSYQPKLCNLPSLVEEILDVCSDANRHQSAVGHLSSLTSELSTMIEPAASRRWITGFEAWRLEELGKARSCKEAEGISKVLLGDGFRHRFEDRIIDEAAKIPSQLPKHKHSADTILSQLATIAMQRGFTAVDDDKVALKLLEKSPENWMAGLLSRLQSRPQEYLVVLVLEQTPKITAAKLEKVFENGGFNIEKHENVPNIQPKGEAVLLSLSVTGTSPTTALQAVLRQTEPILDMLAFYLADRAAELPDHGWVGKSRGELVRTTVPAQSLRLVHPHRNADRLVIDALDFGSRGRLDGSVSNALELHSTAMRAADVRTRFLNLWAALECLASLVDESNTSRRVNALVCPVVTWRKIEKVGRYLSINLHLWRKASGEKADASELTTGRLTTSDVIAALCKPKNHEDILGLLSLAGKHALLRYRIHDVWKDFHDPQVLAKVMASSMERVNWHLKRIYRARNLLVHRGVEAPHLENLCDNLHYYVSVLLSRIIHGVSKNESWRPEDAIKHWQLMGGYVFEKLRKAPHDLVFEDLMPITTAGNARLAPWGHLKQ